MVEPMSVPEELRHIHPYIQRSEELKKFEPVVAYFCKYYAARQAITLENNSDSAQAFLLHLLDELENEKAQLKDNESMKDDTTASDYCTTFGLRVFSGPDKEDREGIATKETAKNFVVASQFLQILAAFGDIPDKIANIIKYSKWRAVVILRAIREGRSPEPPEDPEASQVLDGQEQVIQQPDQRQTDQNDFASWPSPPPPATSLCQEQSPQLHPNPYHSSSSPQPPTLPDSSIPPPQGHILSPSQLPSQPSQIYGPPPQAFSSPPPPQHSVSPINYPNHQQQQQQQQHQQQQQQSVAHNGGPQQPLDSLPSVPPNRVYTGTPSSVTSTSDPRPGAATFIPVPAANLPPINAPDSASSELLLDPTDAKAAQKHARWAISALEYDDVNTAIENLQNAINVLRPYSNSHP